MTLESRLVAAFEAVGADIKALQDAPGGGGGSVGNLVQRIIMSSQDFIAPRDGSYRVTAIGGGGSGGRSSSYGNGLRATGGGAGGFSQKVVQLAKGDELTIIVGAGGVAPAAAGARDGADGGTTTVTGPGIALTAAGGKGGLHGIGAGTTPGAEGGTASGGDVNVTGGGSGSATTAAVDKCKAATGGGAVGIFGVGYSSGDAESSGGFNAFTYGAGVGGKSGDAYASTASVYSREGGPWGPSGDALNGYGVSAERIFPGNITYAGNEAGLPGGVWGMAISGAASHFTGYGQGGRFAGGIGAESSQAANAGGPFGGGAGGVVGASVSATYYGGTGGVIIEYMESW